MKLERISLTNFRKHKQLSISFSENETIITKPNFFGKTTIIDAYLWVLTDKNSRGEKNYSPKPIIDNEEVHGVDSIAELVFDNITLKKVFKEKWESVRGSVDKTFSGHTTEYYINEVPYTKRDYEDYIKDHIADKEMLQSILNVQWWCENKPSGNGWENRRKLLLDMAGDIDYSAIETDEIKELLSNKTVDEAKKQYKEQMKKLNKSIEEIPNRIDEVQRMIDECNDIDVLFVKSEIERLEQCKQELREAIADNENKNLQLSVLKEHLYEAKSEYKRYENEHKEIFYKEQELAREPIVAKENEIRAEERNLDKLEDELRATDRKIQVCTMETMETKNKIAELKKKYEEMKDVEFDSTSAVCTFCKQSYPQDKIETMKHDFNATKSVSLESIVADGKKQKEQLDRLDGHLEELQKDKLACVERINELSMEISRMKSSLDDMRNVKVELIPFNKTDLGKELQQRIKQAEENLASEKSVDTEGFKADIAEFDEQQSFLRDKLAEYGQLSKHKERIDELEAEKVKLANLYLTSERKRYLVEQFEIAQINMLDDTINKNFKTIRFRMFKENIGNDGIQSCCDVLVNTDKGTIPYYSASTSEKIKANLELATSFMNYWNIEIPLFVDNAECISKENRPNVDRQIVWLEVEQSTTHHLA